MRVSDHIRHGDNIDGLGKVNLMMATALGPTKGQLSIPNVKLLNIVETEQHESISEIEEVYNESMRKSYSSRSYECDQRSVTLVS